MIYVLHKYKFGAGMAGDKSVGEMLCEIILKKYLSIIANTYTDLILLYATYGKFYDFFKIYIRQ